MPDIYQAQYITAFFCSSGEIVLSWGIDIDQQEIFAIWLNVWEIDAT